MTLSDLERKYAALLRLRGQTVGDPRATLRALAHEFPGALRELDARRTEDLEERRAALARAAAHEIAAAPWMTAQLHYHSLMRGLLLARRILAHLDDAQGPARIVGAEASVERERFSQAAEEHGDAPLALLWRDELAAVRSPPDGRLSRLALRRVAAAMALSVDEAHALALPARPRADR